MVFAGRRSGKTEFAKRFVVLQAIDCELSDGWYVCAAPTHQQAKRLYWDHLRAMVPPEIVDRVFWSELTIRLIHGPKITVLGLDAPERVEGAPLDGIVLDEYANMKSDAWTLHVRPALSTPGRPPGWAWFIGVPEGRNHAYDLWDRARTLDDWATFHWISADILDPAEIEAAKADMDELSYRQEYEADFVTFTGRAYYPFRRETHCIPLNYWPHRPLIFCFDFNVDPGVASIVQEQHGQCTVKHEDGTETIEEVSFTAVIGEVWQPQNSNTPMVCRRLVQDWGHHAGEVYCYGDSTGGARGAAQTIGTSWEIIRQEMEQAFPGRVTINVYGRNPRERDRVNSVNARLQSVAGYRRLFVDPVACPNTVNDFEGTRLVEGGTGELAKTGDENRLLTHITDAIGYYVHQEHPLTDDTFVDEAM